MLNTSHIPQESTRWGVKLGKEREGAFEFCKWEISFSLSLSMFFFPSTNLFSFTVLFYLSPSLFSSCVLFTLPLHFYPSFTTLQSFTFSLLQPFLCCRNLVSIFFPSFFPLCLSLLSSLPVCLFHLSCLPLCISLYYLISLFVSL